MKIIGIKTMPHKNMYFKIVIGIVFLFLVSCENMNFTEQEVIEDEPIFICDEAAFSDLGGQSQEALQILLEIINFNGELRIIPHDGFIPMDFIPNRLTITLHENEDISRAFCG